MRLWVPSLVALLIAFTPAAAQVEQKSRQGYIAGGYSDTVGLTADYLEAGWNISGGVLLRPVAKATPFGIRFDLGYNDFAATNKLLNVDTGRLRVDGGGGSVWAVTADLLWEFNQKGKVGVYLGAGFGGYRRYVELTQTVIESGVICDPWWGYCYDAVVPGDAIVANNAMLKFGWNAAIGIGFHMQNGATVYLEGRYHAIDTPHTTEYIPIVIGYRF